MLVQKGDDFVGGLVFGFLCFCWVFGAWGIVVVLECVDVCDAVQFFLDFVGFVSVG